MAQYILNVVNRLFHNHDYLIGHVSLITELITLYTYYLVINILLYLHITIIV